MSVGIDFGTTNSVVATFQDGKAEVVRVDRPPSLDWNQAGFDRVFPSVYGLDVHGAPMFGWAAKQAGREKVEAVKRLFASQDTVEVNGEVVLVEEIAGMLFGRLRRAALDEGVEFSRAVVSIPANSRGLARYRTKLCAGLAGIEVAALVNEPTAAAMAFGLDVSRDQRILVVDWGGGTLDVTFLQVDTGIFVEHASKGIQSLGGRDFDRLLSGHLLTDIDTSAWSEGDHRRFELEVELAKIRLTADHVATVPYPDGHGRNLTRKELDSWMRPLVERAREPIETCLFDAGVSTSGIDHLVLIGGTCMMPTVREFVSEIVGREASPGCNPLTAVAEGAAVASAILDGTFAADFFVSTEHALGTIAIEAGVPSFSQIIGRNHKLPARESDVYYPMHDFQDAIHIAVIEGDPEKPLDDADNVILREWDLPIEPRPRGVGGFEFTYEYDISGILHVSVVDKTTATEVMKADVSFIETVSSKDLVEMRDRLEEVVQGADEQVAEPAPLPDDVRHVLERARTKVIPFVSEEEAERLENLAIALELAVFGGEHSDALQELDLALRKHAYLY
jgi:molecular chaperone DnaK